MLRPEPKRGWRMSATVDEVHESGVGNELDVTGEERLYQALHRFWHPVAYAADVAPGPTAATLLERPLVLARLDGQVRAFADACLNRGVALSIGRVEDGTLRCVHDGWAYGPDGRCVAVPGREPSEIPERARLRSYRVEERVGLVWVCLDPEPVFPIPEFPEFGDPAFRTATVPAYDWKASATRRVENFVDFAHFAWIHDGVLASREHPEVPEHEVWRDGAELRFQITVPEPARNEKTSTMEVDSQDPTVPGERNYRLTMPFTVWLQQRFPGGNEYVIFMSCSPLGRKTCRSFTFNARNFALDEDDARYIRFQQEIVEADRVVSESQRPEELPVDLTIELHVRGVDHVSIEYRRWLIELMKAYGPPAPDAAPAGAAG
jgi:methylxanthine N1-demethylase